MKKALKKTINYLFRYIGMEMVRTKPVLMGRKNNYEGEECDWYENSYMAEAPIVFEGFTNDGRIIARYSPRNACFAYSKECFVLDLRKTDRNWVTYKKALRPKGNRLNAWRGKKIIRTCRNPFNGDPFCTDRPVKLIAASKYAVIYQGECGSPDIMGMTYANPNEWRLFNDYETDNFR